jgi:hypothetical protein
MKPTTWPFFWSACTTRFLCAGESAHKRPCRQPLGQLLVGHFFHVVAEQDFFGVDADLRADFARDQIVVAGQNFHGHAMLAQRGDGGFGRVLGRIEKRQIAGQNQFSSSALE